MRLVCSFNNIIFLTSFITFWSRIFTTFLPAISPCPPCSVLNIFMFNIIILLSTHLLVKMSSYITTADNVRLEDIRSNVNPGNEALLSLIESLEEQGVQLSDEARSSFKVFSKSLEHRRLRRIFQLKVTQYSAGEDSLQDMRQTNHDLKVT